MSGLCSDSRAEPIATFPSREKDRRSAIWDGKTSVLVDRSRTASLENCIPGGHTLRDQTATKPANGAYHAARLLRRLKGDSAVTAALSEAGLDTSLIADHSSRISLSKLVAFFDACARQADDAYFGLHTGEAFDLTWLELPGYVAKFSPDLGTGIQASIRYLKIISPADVLAFQDSGNIATLTFICSDPLIAIHPHHREFSVSGVLSFMRILTDSRLRPIEVRFQHARNGTLRPFEQFFGCPVAFGAENTELLLKPESLKLPILSADAKLLGMIIEYGDRLIQEAREKRPGLRAKVEKEIIEHLPHTPPTAENVAASLGMSSRTFARRLNELGTSFREVSDQTRHSLAQYYLEDEGFSHSEIAYLVGYADQPSFISAFRRWSGMTPGAYRESRLHGNAN
jgi:AraC-like DNA-binding protein